MPERIKIKDVIVGEGRRPVDIGHVERLAQSIAKVGLLHPITLSRENVLIAGRHRLEAAIRLKWKEIDCLHFDLDEIDAELAEVDENLLQKQMKTGERAALMARSKALYEVKYPGTRKGGDMRRYTPNRGNRASLPPSFTADRAAKIGISERNVQEYVQIGERLTDRQLEVLDEAGVKKNEMLQLVRQDKAVIEQAVATVAQEGRDAIQSFVDPRKSKGKAPVRAEGEPPKAPRRATVRANGELVPTRFVNPGERPRESSLNLYWAVNLEATARTLADYYTPDEWARLDALVREEYRRNGKQED